LTRDLEGKTALVTGGARGIGRGVAKSLAAAGALVAVNYASNDAAAQAAVAEIEAAGGQAFALRAQLRDPGAGAELAKTLAAELVRRTGEPGLDILVNNIGGAIAGTTATLTPEDFDWIFDNNLRAGFFLTQALMPALRDGGRVINISSPGARIGTPQFIAYGMSKAAVDCFTRILAKELGPRRITVNSVSPGYTVTEAVAPTINDPEKAQAIVDTILFGRLGQPEDIGEFVRALASDQGGWVTGQVIEVSGGMRL
jgi:NAD(P)-dependent dehydrogenase (short-subunit alcohol dehydrogenase family)